MAAASSVLDREPWLLEKGERCVYIPMPQPLDRRNMGQHFEIINKTVAAYARKAGYRYDSRVCVYNSSIRKSEVGFVTKSDITYSATAYPRINVTISTANGSIVTNKPLQVNNISCLPYGIILPPEDTFRLKEDETYQWFIDSKRPYSNERYNSSKPPSFPNTTFFGKSAQTRNSEKKQYDNWRAGVNAGKADRHATQLKQFAKTFEDRICYLDGGGIKIGMFLEILAKPKDKPFPTEVLILTADGRHTILSGDGNEPPYGILVPTSASTAASVVSAETSSTDTAVVPAASVAPASKGSYAKLTKSSGIPWRKRPINLNNGTKGEELSIINSSAGTNGVGLPTVSSAASAASVTPAAATSLSTTPSVATAAPLSSSRGTPLSASNVAATIRDIIQSKGTVYNNNEHPNDPSLGGFRRKRTIRRRLKKSKQTRRKRIPLKL